MLLKEELAGILSRIDGKGYKAYKDIQGDYDFGEFKLFIDYVQGDPYAPPSKIRLRLSMNRAGFPAYIYKDVRVIALEDIIARRIKQIIQRKDYGTGNGGLISIAANQQEVLKRTAVKINSEYVEARLSIGLPANGRRIKSAAARLMLFEILPDIVKKAMYLNNYREEEIREQVLVFEDQEFIRSKLDEYGLVSFIANDSILPRKSGDSNLPMKDNEAVRFISPPTMEVETETLHHGLIKGMGIPRGVSLIVGGGYHGKTTLLKAIERGVYNHRPGDGREWVITVADAVKIRAEDGRNVEKVNITPFIDNLPFRQNTEAFSSSNASGSTSQAANIMEALEAGVSLLLLDEDSSATNFMIRDARMQKLVSKDKEPITPFLDRVRQLYEIYGVSTLLVIGGSGDYLDVCDRVIMMLNYKPEDRTEEAQRIAKEINNSRNREEVASLKNLNPRIIKKNSFSFFDESRTKISAKGLHTIMLGRETVNLHAVEQLLDIGQTNTIAESIKYMYRYIDDKCSLNELINVVYSDIKNDLEVLSFYGREKHPGDLALPRKMELAAAVNRLRTLRID